MRAIPICMCVFLGWAIVGCSDAGGGGGGELDASTDSHINDGADTDLDGSADMGIDNDAGTGFMGHFSDSGQINDIHLRVRRRLHKDHGGRLT